MPGLLKVALDRRLVLAQPAAFGFQFYRADFAMRPEKHQIGKAGDNAHPFQSRRGHLVALLAARNVRVDPAFVVAVWLGIKATLGK